MQKEEVVNLMVKTVIDQYRVTGKTHNVAEEELEKWITEQELNIKIMSAELFDVLLAADIIKN
jgi:hypothetical protein